jgi:hypothetical protein
MQIFMQGSRNQVLNGLSRCVGSKACAQAFTEASYPAAIIFRMTGELPHSGPGSDTAKGSLAKGRVFPLLPIGMGLLRLRYSCMGSRQQPPEENELRDSSHTG